MKQIARVRAPNNFTWKIIEGSTPYYKTKYVKVQLVLKRSKRIVGSVTLYESEDGSYETHSYLDSKYHNKGFGTKLYARAIQWGLVNGVKIRSSGCTSSEAQRVWRGKGIRKYFRIVTKHYPGYPDPSNDVFHAYRKPKRR